MDDGLRQYMLNLEATQRRDHADRDIINQYSRLADRTIAAETKQQSIEAELGELRLSDVQSKGRVSKTSSPALPSDEITRLRNQLAEAQKARAQLEAQTVSIPTLEAEKRAQTKSITSKDREITNLKIKLRDREEEIKVKQKMSEQAQDELISLTLQANMADERAKKFQEENEELVGRWMKKKAEEAEKMNEQSRW
ncbi:autophagy protein 16 [Tothia fuscella]|uniref:Autophagy protein 16 n=1 Tax=Tothia fuscella TaxID=1048955 RepID=A0A9P4NX20_9PEZI|nr:autophagy protein 16 [Tothia fuscella]